jgi:hypothetical protein
MLRPLGSMIAFNELMASFLYCFRFYLGQAEDKATHELMGRLNRWGHSRMYGLGNWYHCHGELDKAAGCYATALNSSNWPSFAFIAAELELAAGL